MYNSPRLRGGNRFSGESLRKVCSDFGSPPSVFFPAARREPVCRRVAIDVCGDFGSPPSGTGCEFCCGVFQKLYTKNVYRLLRGGNRFAVDSLVTFAAIMVRLQAEREGGDFVVASFNQFTPCIFFAGCAGGTGLTATL